MSNKLNKLSTVIFIFFTLCSQLHASARDNEESAVNLVAHFYERLISFNYELEEDSNRPFLALSKSLEAELEKNEELCKKFGEGPCGLGGIHDLYTNNFEGETNLTPEKCNLTVSELSEKII